MATRDHAKEIDDVRADIEALREDIGKLTDSLGKDMASDAARATEAIRSRVSDAAANAGDQLRAGTDAVGQRVEEHPVASMAVAFGAGLLIGKLVSR